MAGILGFLKCIQAKLKDSTQKPSPKAKSDVDISSRCSTDQPYLPKVGKTHRVVGLNYRQENVMMLASENPNYTLAKDQIIKLGLTNTHIHKYLFTNSPVTLEQEPTNPHDPNAIKVVVNGLHIGYIKAGSCAHLNKVINEGRVEKILCRIYGGPSVGVYTTVDEDTGKLVLKLERDSSHISAEIRVIEKPEK